MTKGHCITQEKLTTVSILKTNCTEKCNTVNITLVVIEERNEVHLKKKLSMYVRMYQTSLKLRQAHSVSLTET